MPMTFEEKMAQVEATNQAQRLQLANTFLPVFQAIEKKKLMDETLAQKQKEADAKLAPIKQAREAVYNTLLQNLGDPNAKDFNTPYNGVSRAQMYENLATWKGNNVGATEATALHNSSMAQYQKGFDAANKQATEAQSIGNLEEMFKDDPPAMKIIATGKAINATPSAILTDINSAHSAATLGDRIAARQSLQEAKAAQKEQAKKVASIAPKGGNRGLIFFDGDDGHRRSVSVKYVNGVWVYGDDTDGAGKPIDFTSDNWVAQNDPGNYTKDNFNTSGKPIPAYPVKRIAVGKSDVFDPNAALSNVGL